MDASGSGSRGLTFTGLPLSAGRAAPAAPAAPSAASADDGATTAAPSAARADDGATSPPGAVSVAFTALPGAIDPGRDTRSNESGPGG